MKIEVPVRATININGRKLICLEKKSHSCRNCALKDCYCYDVLCDAMDRSDGKDVDFEPFTGVLFDKRDVIVNIGDIINQYITND